MGKAGGYRPARDMVTTVFGSLVYYFKKPKPTPLDAPTISRVLRSLRGTRTTGRMNARKAKIGRSKKRVKQNEAIIGYPISHWMDAKH